MSRHPVRRLDQVDWNRAMAPAFILRSLLRGPAAGLVREQLQAWHSETWSSGGPLIEPNDLATVDGCEEELAHVIEAVLQPLSQGAHHVEVASDCVMWRRRQEAAPTASEEVFCESCRAVHQVAGQSSEGLDTTLSTPVVPGSRDTDPGHTS